MCMLEWEGKISIFTFAGVGGLHMVLGLYVSRRRVAQWKITPSFPAPSTISFRPAWLGPGWAVGQAAGGKGRGQFRPFVPARQPATRPQATVPIGCAAKLPATPWTGWAYGALGQATRGPLSFYAFWWVFHTTMLWTLSPLNLQPGDWGKNVHFSFTLPGVLSWGRAGSGWTVKSLEASPCVLEIVVWTWRLPAPLYALPCEGEWLGCVSLPGSLGWWEVSAGEFSCKGHMIGSFPLSSAVTISFFWGLCFLISEVC